MIPEPLRTQINGIRIGAGDTQLSRIDPHVTLYPPAQVDEWEVPAGIDALASVAAQVEPFDLTIGPVATFDSDSLVSYLDVPDPTGALARLRAACFVAPFDRPDERTYRPHVTVAIRSERARVEALVTALADASWRTRVEAVSLLELVEIEGTTRRWSPIAELPLGRSAQPRRSGIRPLLTAAWAPGTGAAYGAALASALIDHELVGTLAVSWTRGDVVVGEAHVRPGFEGFGIGEALERFAQQLRPADGWMPEPRPTTE
jgi:2'-5' RNA ligase